MTSKLSQVKKIILEILSDGKEHTSEEIRNLINEEGIELDKKCSTMRTAIYQLRNNGTEIYSRDRGVYQIKEKNKSQNPILDGFTTVIPEERSSPKYIYIHADGNIVLNGRLNRAIESREIEIKVNDNGKKLALIPGGENNHKFTKSGSTKNMGLLKLLKCKHISVPATYEMELDSNTGIWIGKIYKNVKKN